jgi:hypothetical protein
VGCHSRLCGAGGRQPCVNVRDCLWPWQ